jgi:hypothetical protein
LRRIDGTPLRAAELLGNLALQERAATLPVADERESLTTAIHIRRDHWELLREVAFSRARATGGRSSVSSVIAELIEHQRARLAREIEGR